MLSPVPLHSFLKDPHSILLLQALQTASLLPAAYVCKAQDEEPQVPDHNYQKSKDKELYEREHDYQLRLFEGAKSWLKNTGIDPATLKIRDIEEHLRKLEADRKAFLSSSEAKAAEHEQFKSIEKSLNEFLEEPSISDQLSRHKDRNIML